MHVQVVTYGLGALSESQYLDVANDLAPRFSGASGLQAKIWLEDPEQGRYGAIYFWDDREAMERFERSGLFETSNRNLVDVESEGFSVLENLTAQTQPVLELIEARRQPAVRRPPPRAVPRAASATTTTAKAGRARKIPITTKAASGKTQAKAAASKAAASKAAPAKRTPAKKATKKSTR